jgi:hypothetical protein
MPAVCRAMLGNATMRPVPCPTAALPR